MCPLIDFVQILELILCDGYARHLTKHFKQSFDVGLTIFDAIGIFFIIVFLDYLSEFDEFGVVVDEERVDG